ncbi:MAG: peptidoglycan editing factor PgeF [Thalassobaculales bacterium]
MIQVDALEHPRLRHAFYGRRGGVSRGLYTSLNCGLGSADDREAVIANRARCMAAIDLPAAALVTCHQTHSADCMTVERRWEPAASPKADAMATSVPGIALGVLAADCVPVLFAAAQDGVIGAAHAGWKGAKAGVCEATVEAMIELGARPDRIVAVIGPCIQQESYEVGDEFAAEFLKLNRANARYFAAGRRAGKLQFDISGYVAGRLSALGLAEVHRLDFDTCRDEANFFSYRRSVLRGEPDYGRQISVIALDH